MDTVPLAAPVQPVLVDGGWENANDGILGADNKSAVAVILELARRLTRGAEAAAARASSCCSPSARRSRCRVRGRSTSSRLQSAFGYVFDHATPIGELVVASPTHYRDRRRPAWPRRPRRVRPEAGRSAVLAAARGDRGDDARTPRRRDDSQRRHDRGRNGDQRDPRALPHRGRGPQPRRGSRSRGRDRDDRSSPGCAPTGGVRSRPRGASGCSAATDEAGRAPQLAVARERSRHAATSRARSSPAEPRTSTRSSSRVLRRCAWPTASERNHEPTERVSVDALEGMFDIALTLLDEAAVNRRRPAVTGATVGA